MKFFKNPWVRLAILALIIASLLYLPTREFLKVTFILGMPFVFLAGFMHKQAKRSPQWVIAAILLAAVGATYIYALVQLPERIQVRRIVAAGSTLVQEGKYDKAIAEYSKLELIGKSDKMKAKIEEVEREKKGQRDLELARQLIKQGDLEEARKLLETIPPKTRAAQEAVKMLKDL